MFVEATQPTPYEQHRDYVLGVLSRRCAWLDPSDREALLHDAYAVFLEKQHEGQLDGAGMHSSQVRAYLTQTALNKAMDEGKRAGRRRSVSLDDETLGIDPADPGRELDDRLATRFDDARVREIVAELPERRQLVIKLRFFFNRTPQEIQRYMGITERVYRRELERATRQLAERLELVRDGTFCDSRRSLILAYVTGVAGPNRMLEARRHLETCPACAAWTAELRAAGRRAAAIVPAPLLALHFPYARASRMVWAGRAIRTWANNLAASTRGHAMRAFIRADPSRLAALSGARPSAVAMVITGCVAGGSTATYCVVHGFPAPLRAFVGVSPDSGHHAPAVRRAIETSKYAAGPTALASRRLATVIPVPGTTKPPETALIAQGSGGVVRARGSQPVSGRSAVPADSEAERVHEATAPEFGVGGGSPVSAAFSPSSSPSAPSSRPPRTSPSRPSPSDSPPPPAPSKPLPEFDP